MPSSPLLKSRNWAMSVPAAKALSPAPVTTMTLASPVLPMRSQMSARPRYMAKVSALRACGRLKVTQATSPRLS